MSAFDPKRTLANGNTTAILGRPIPCLYERIAVLVSPDGYHHSVPEDKRVPVPLCLVPLAAPADALPVYAFWRQAIQSAPNLATHSRHLRSIFYLSAVRHRHIRVRHGLMRLHPRPSSTTKNKNATAMNPVQSQSPCGLRLRGSFAILVTI